ncbi:enoyl-CoA hydratase/isomerase family protein [Psychrobacter urativorans]|uniref:3-hydroxyisobutyryl-CoA hydrolase n=1 Tax=Psychrobacter urativorans TaxID=45610 RepID=A0A0M3V9L7_9GAMM|nr:enoyl-CoA hydratase/isomerase family protein [Psychrobacter urativorans]ALF60887.1 crotonase [Psychrobacter urativorans]
MPVAFSTEATNCGQLIGIMTLNAPKSLNALSVEMCKLLTQQLEKWQADNKVVAVLLKGAGDKAFCAGGDIRKLYDSMSDSAPMPNPYATEFFANEYRLFRQMHFYSKPLILWGDGIIMGGGMGLLAACSHRIVTERTRFAMPEVTIGLFPDASGSWFLPRMPAKTGLFLGLTGAQCNGSDALLVNLAEYAVASHDYETVLQHLIDSDWQSIITSDDEHSVKTSHSDTAHSITSRALATLPVANLPESKLGQYWQPIQRLMNSGGLADIDAILQNDTALAQLDASFAADKWTQKAVVTYRHGCPVTVALAYTLYQQTAQLSLEQILYLETNVAVHCAANPDFKEGVRALLIDKDKTPQWSRSLADCLTAEGSQYIRQHFSSPYPNDEHPFDEWLGSSAIGAQKVR